MSHFDERALSDLKKLCRIQCSAEEDADIIHSLSKVLEYVRLLNEVETQGVPSCNFVLKGMLNRSLREDEISDLIAREQFLENAPDQVGGMIRVPPVLKAP